MDPNNSRFIKELKDNWDEYFDQQENKSFYFNMILGKRQWEYPFIENKVDNNIISNMEKNKIKQDLQKQERIIIKSNQTEQSFNSQQALDKLLDDLVSQDKQQKIQQKSNQPIFPEKFKSSTNKKRPSNFSVGKVFQEALHDPIDPTGGMGKNSDIIGSMSKAADETAQGALFQQRPYANPRKVLQLMEKRKNMF